MANFLELAGNRISEDDNSFVCLNDLHRLIGSPPTKAPAQWQRLPGTRELVEAVLQNVGKSHIKATANGEVIYSRRGKGGGTFAHPVIALAFAEYLDARIGVDVREVYLRYRGSDPLLADEILQRAGPEANRLAVQRAMSRELRKEYTATLQAHGVGDHNGMAQCTNGIYRGYLGRTAKQELVARNLPATANLRDEMNLVDLTGVMLSEALATEDIREANHQGQSACYKASKESGASVRQFIDSTRSKRKAAPSPKPDTIDPKTKHSKR